MNRGAIWVGAIVALASSPAHGAEIKWAKSLNAALSAAKAGNRLVMADFYTDW